MGTRIESVATVHSHPGFLGRGALSLSDAAVRACLRRAHRHARELDLLVNAGLYKDHSLAEPALASIIQEDVGANAGDPPRPDRHGTFSFDVLSGGCGVLSAAQLVDLFVGTGTARLGLVVAADADPGTATAFPFPSVGGALLLGHTEGDEGFGPFASRGFPELGGLFEAHVKWEPGVEGSDGRGRNVLEVREDPAFAERCVELGAEVATAFLDAAGLDAEDVDLLVASQYPRRFAVDLARACGVKEQRVPPVRGDLRDAHTAGPIAALEAAMDAGLYQRAQTVLFVTAGAGLTIAAALYTK